MTYSELALVLDTLGKGIDDVVVEPIVSDVQILKAFVASEVGEDCAEGLLVVNHVVFERERLQLRQVGHFLSDFDDGVIG